MKRSILLGTLLIGVPGLAAAQSAQNLTDQQLEGRRLFQQSCGVCHTKPTITSPLFGPALSKATFAKGDAQPQAQIADGSPNMPAFKYQFTTTQIEAIVAYLKTTDEEAHKAPAAK